MEKNDEVGNRLEGDSYEPQGNLVSKTTWKYDNNGNEIEAINFSPRYGNIKLRSTGKYDNDNNETEWKSYKGDGSFLQKITHKNKRKRFERKLDKKNDHLTMIVLG